MRDMMNNIGLADAGVVTTSDNTALVGPIVDTRGADSLTFLIGAGTLADADATFVVLVEEDDAANLSGATPVADSDLVGTEVLAAFTFAEDQKARKIGYVGSKRYVRTTITPAANTGSAPIAIIPILGYLHQRPASNP